ncbi:hypothetical protein EDC04DRAFT_2864868 [Pisolithus marmoratus]|nr:hypothetical protein EDC04DRAFT_2864868 [Pisolithus marmoratus]
MSAYGVISESCTPGDLSSIYDIASPGAKSTNGQGLFEYLHVFADGVGKGMTSSQEDMRNPITSASYFFAVDVIIAILDAKPPDEDTPVGTSSSEVNHAVMEVNLSLEACRGGQGGTSRLTFTTCPGFFRVKPNYPVRWSRVRHGYGRVLAMSYFHDAPRLGYTASAFNYIYVNNQASIRQAIPNAGRLRHSDGEGEEYVDAWVV